MTHTNQILKTAIAIICFASSIHGEVGETVTREFRGLPEAATDKAQNLAVVFDYQGCYPSPAVSTVGSMNPGLHPSGPIYGQCREPSQLDNANTYYRTVSIDRGGATYAVHMYALYFMKDQVLDMAPRWPIAGHRHDWEFALVWTKDGDITHASYSTHGQVVTRPIETLHVAEGKSSNVKVVYYKDGLGTHAFRFAKVREAQNRGIRWHTPTIVDWSSMASELVSNADLRELFNNHPFGKANCSFNDHNFPKEIAKDPPEGYPAGGEWERAARRESVAVGRPRLLAIIDVNDGPLPDQTSRASNNFAITPPRGATGLYWELTPPDPNVSFHVSRDVRIWPDNTVIRDVRHQAVTSTDNGSNLYIGGVSGASEPFLVRVYAHYGDE